jgi:hypothetical protein
MDDTMIQALDVALGLALSLMVYSYLLGDNPLYRIAVHVLVGTGMGYASVVVIYTVLIPQVITPVEQLLLGGSAGMGQPVLLIAIVLPLTILLLLKLSPHTAPWGNLTMGFVMGVGAAVAVSGAVLGTLSLSPGSQALASPGQDGMTNLLAGLVLVAGTITSLLYFHFSAQRMQDETTQRPGWIRLSAQVGQVFLMITFGSLFAGALIASLSVLTARAQFYIDWLSQWFG